jgi:hypothetical protein
MPCAACLQHGFSPVWPNATPQVSKEREAYLAGAATQADFSYATPNLQDYTMIFEQMRIKSTPLVRAMKRSTLWP